MIQIEFISCYCAGDEDIVEDIDTLRDALAKDVLQMSSFDVYKREILSGNLEWSPVHRSEKFWCVSLIYLCHTYPNLLFFSNFSLLRRENVARLEENQCQVLKALVEILKTSSDGQNLSIACFDIGEFSRFHPRGRVCVSLAFLLLL